ncbi:glycosyltransferase family protein [Novosphingobium soli]|uniref:Glycosyltransferase family 9 protein n=1 Tax=Novosphingobium soli TaxID=574956 RepID=A0ABV6CZL9_9SPHN
MTDDMLRWTEAMRAGRYEAAWSLAERAMRSRDPATRDDPSRPYHQRWVWDGRSCDAKRVLVRCYHGLGDTIQFARYLPLLARRAASVTVEVQPSLIPLLATLPGNARLVPFDPAHPLPPAECDIEIGELDRALRTAPPAVQGPYLKAPRALLPHGTLGLCYGSGDWDPERSIPAPLLEPLCGLAPCITLVAEPTALPVHNPAGCPLDMDVTASLVAGCALVITVDTMIAHLAGALGVPTWLLLKAEPDWRWNPGARSTPWYPAMRLYVQPQPGDWQSVIDTVVRDLTARADLMMER